MNARTITNMLAVCGAAAGMVAIASAETPTLINITGATAQASLLRAPALTNDFIDVDGDGFTTVNGGDQLVVGTNLPPTDPILPAARNKQWWHVSYREIGSGNGLAELIAWGQNYATSPGDVVTNPVPRANYNRSQFIANSAVSGVGNIANPGAMPARSTMPVGCNQSPAVRTDGTGGIRFDIAPLDVPVSWFVTADGTPDFGRTPTQAGYGLNPAIARNRDGTFSATSNILVPLTGNLNTNPPASADENTLFDNSIAFVVVNSITNLGVGKTQVDKSELQWLYTTGRGKGGENLVVVTRDSRSGTRNAFMNSLAIDPSWGVGDNTGLENAAAGFDNLGAAFIPSNKAGSGNLTTAVANHRLAIGTAGTDSALPAYLAGRIEYVAVRNDTKGGVVYARPTTANCLDNSVDGYQIGGPASWVTIGDPRSAPVNKGGDANGNPCMRNIEAAALVNNVTRSIAAFAAAPGDDATLFTPGEFAALNFIPIAALDFIQDPNNGNILIANPDLNQTLQNFVRNNSTLNQIQNTYGAITLNGDNPVRVSLTGTNVYSDNVALGANYISQGGAPLSNGADTLARNRIAGDFNGDGLRNINDAEHMLRAWSQRNGGAVWNAPNGSGAIAGAPGANACIEILGDFNGDGNFGRVWDNSTLSFSPDFSDVRYWADGLGVDASTGDLDRLAAFTAVDQAWLAVTGSVNFFNTTLANPGATYNAGDSAADIAGPGGNVTPGFAPIGADGVIDANDIDYIYAQFKTNPNVTDGALNWSNLAEAIGGDLSADINGDLVIDQADVCFLVTQILETGFGDANLDGAVDSLDVAIVTANIGNPGGWAAGDFDGDGVVTANDLAIVNGKVDPCAPPCTCVRGQGDANNDCLINGADLSVLLSQFGQSVTPNTGADFNGDGQVNGADLSVLLSNFGCQ